MNYFEDYSAYIDGAVMLILILSGTFALFRGFVKEFLGLASWILATLAVLYAIPASRPFTDGMFKSRLTADIVVGMVVALVVLITCTLINYNITKRVKNSPLSGLDRTLGLIFGLIRGMFIAVIIYLIASFNFSKELREGAGYSLFNPLLKRSSDMIMEYLSSYESEQSSLDELFEKLNTPEVKPVNKEKEQEPRGYKKRERESLNKLIMETEEDDADPADE